MTLDQTLTEVEPVFRCTDGTFQFTHPSFQEVLAAKQFADEINSGRLSVIDAYLHFWSYEEDAELWGLEELPDVYCTSLLPSWKQVILNLAPMLKREAQDELHQRIKLSYLAFDRYKVHPVNSLLYNPFFDDLDFALVDLLPVIGGKKGDRKDKQDITVGSLLLLGFAEPGFFKRYTEFPSEAELSSWRENVKLFGELMQGKRGFDSFPVAKQPSRDLSNMDYAIEVLANPNSQTLSEAIYMISKYGGRQEIMQLIPYLSDGSVCGRVWDAIHKIHPRLKPQGYNPAVKRLAA